MIKIIEKTDCCGCSACVNACPKECISLEYDEEGFKYPNVCQEECVKCERCVKVCPIINKKSIKKFDQYAYLVQNKDSKILDESTAGGAFSAIAKYIVQNNGIVYGACFDDNYKVIHTSAMTLEDLSKFRNSKYVQSDLGKTFKEVKKYLDEDRLVCYSGTPCQIEGLLLYLGKKYDNLVTVDVVCRAVPSPGVWNDYLKLINNDGEIESIRFRDKTLGYHFSTMEVKYNKNNTQRGGIESQPWLRMFFSGMIIRESCSKCKFRSQYRNSDFTIWDCFNVYHLDKSLNEEKGVTRVLLHTDKAIKIFKIISSDLEYREITIDKAVENVREFVQSPEINNQRKEFFDLYRSESLTEALNKFFPLTPKVKIKKNIRLLLNFVGLDKTIKHFLKKG